MINHVVLVGRLTRDPELRYTTTQKPFAFFGLAVERRFRNQAGERETDFFNVTAWGKTAELVNQYMKKGRLVGVEGRIEQRKYTAKDGTERTTFDIVAENVTFLDRGTPAAGEDVPPPPGVDAEFPPQVNRAVDVEIEDSDLPF